MGFGLKDFKFSFNDQRGFQTLCTIQNNTEIVAIEELGVDIQYCISSLIFKYAKALPC